MVDIATPTRPVHVGPPALRASLATNLKWSVGLTAAAIAYFVFYYLDTYFRGSIPDFLHDFMTTWLPIQPWPTEVRFIPGEAGQTRQFANNNSANINGPMAASFTSNPWINQADQAYQSGNVEKAKQLTPDVAIMI